MLISFILENPRHLPALLVAAAVEFRLNGHAPILDNVVVVINLAVLLSLRAVQEHGAILETAPRTIVSEARILNTSLKERDLGGDTIWAYPTELLNETGEAERPSMPKLEDSS